MEPSWWSPACLAVQPRPASSGDPGRLVDQPGSRRGLANLDTLAWQERFDLVITAGVEPLPQLPATVVTAGDFPHSELMPKVAAVVSSAGYGTVTRAACAGVGVLAVPHMGDQPLVAGAVVQSGLGASLSPDELTVERLQTTLDGVLATGAPAGERLRTAAQTYRAALTSAELIESFVATS
jgi:UDP:flavonoid glycosyltransferase YjiC (YdhE family)